MKRLSVLLALAACAASVFAYDLSFNVQGAYYISNHAGYGESGFAAPDYSEILKADSTQRDLGSSWGGAEIKFVGSIAQKMPFLVGDGLFSGNNLRGEFNVEVSPVSLNGVGSVSFTPIAFLVFEGGAGIGSGWSIPGLFEGLAVNNAGTITPTDFGGAVWRVWGAGTFQFDVAALLPGEWNHVVVVANAKVEYKANTGVSDNVAWLWEADEAMNFNGAKFYGTYVLGYQMPLALSMIGFIADSEEWIGAVRDYSPMASSGGWGSDFRMWQLGGLFNFKLTEKDSLTTLVQFKCKRDWTDATTRNADFRSRDYEDAYWYFNRIAFSYTHSF